MKTRNPIFDDLSLSFDIGSYPRLYDKIRELVTKAAPDFQVSIWLWETSVGMFYSITPSDESSSLCIPPQLATSSQSGREIATLIEHLRPAHLETILGGQAESEKLYVVASWGKEVPVVFEFIRPSYMVEDPTLFKNIAEQYASAVLRLLEKADIELRRRLLTLVVKANRNAKSWNALLKKLESLFSDLFHALTCRIMMYEKRSISSKIFKSPLRILELDKKAAHSSADYVFIRDWLKKESISKGSFLGTSVAVELEEEGITTHSAEIFLIRDIDAPPFLVPDQQLFEFAIDLISPSLSMWNAQWSMKDELLLEKSFKNIIEALYITDYPDIDPLLHEIVTQAQKVFGVYSCSLLLKVRGEDKLRVEKGLGYGDLSDQDLIVPYGKGLSGLAASTKTTMVVADVLSDSRYIAVLPAIRSEICAPMLDGDGCLGVINLASTEVGRFQPNDAKTIGAVETFAKQIAIALTRADLLRERDQLRTQLVKTTQLITASSVASGVAHELKNGLLAIATFAQKLETDPAVRPREDTRRRLEAIRAESKKLSDLALRLMVLSRVGEPRRKPVYLNDLVAGTLQLLNDLVSTKQMKITATYDPALDEPTSGAGHPVFVDESQIGQVITNLVLNAVDASTPKQRIDVETHNRTDEFAEITVRDYGAGIAPQDKPRIFDMFFTTKENGFGIGLPVVKTLVEEHHGGRIEFDTKSGRGTTFQILLPKNQGE